MRARIIEIPKSMMITHHAPKTEVVFFLSRPARRLRIWPGSGFLHDNKNFHNAT